MPDITPIVIPSNLLGYRPVTDITPFTQRSGMTYQALLEGLREYVTGYLTQYLIDEFSNFEESWETSGNTIITQVNTAVNAAVNQVINGSIPVNDALTTAIVNLDNSSTVAALFARVGQQRMLNGINERFIGGTWHKWDSTWIDFISGVTYPNTGVSFNATTARYRYAGGKVHYLFSGTFGNITGDYIKIGIPAPRDPAGGLAYSTGYGVHAGNRYGFKVDFASTTAVSLYFTSNGASGQEDAMTGGSPVGWTSGDPLQFEMTYDPA